MTRVLCAPSALTRARFLTGLFALFSLMFLPDLAWAAQDATAPAANKKRLLIVTVTKGFRHKDSIPIAEKVLADLGEKTGQWTVDYVRTDEEMATKMTRQALNGYDGVVFASTTGELPLPDRDGFLDWIREGHAFIGMHAATDTFHKWPDYLAMIGAHFKTHGPQVTVDCLNRDPAFPAMQTWGGDRMVHDEIYQFDTYEPHGVHRLIDLDKHPNNKTPGDYPIAWNKMYGKGRVFYTALGHRPDVWNSDYYQQHITGGIRWALGLVPGYATPQPPPAEAPKPAAPAKTALRRSGTESKITYAR